MLHRTRYSTFLFAAVVISLGGLALAERAEVGNSPWGPDDELGRLNLMTDASRAAILGRITSGKVYDLSVDYFIGMPGWFPAGDPRYNFWMTHTPRGTVVDDPLGVGTAQNQHVSYSGSAVSMYAHTGTHIDALNHFGLNGKIFNGFSADEHLGDRGWAKTGAETIPPIVARGIIIDVASAKGLQALPPGYFIEEQDIVTALRRQKLSLAEGDVVLLRTGRMQIFENTDDYLANPPGLGMSGAKFLVENGAMVIGGDNLSLEAFPSQVAGNYIPVHTFLLAQHGIPILELVNLEPLIKDKVYEFAFIGGSLKLRGADAAPLRPIAIPIR
ncbi:MAG: cyclase family protein [Woeseia sp.]